MKLKPHLFLLPVLLAWPISKADVISDLAAARHSGLRAWNQGPT
jgi:hypothetical protein